MVVGVGFEDPWSFENETNSMVGLKNKFLLWDVFLKKGYWSGPNYCSLCKFEVESIEHPFVHCLYMKEVRTIIIRKLNPKYFWSNLCLECFQKWMMASSMVYFKSIPRHLVYSIWWDRNLSIFQDKFIPPKVTMNLVFKLALE